MKRFFLFFIIDKQNYFIRFNYFRIGLGNTQRQKLAYLNGTRTIIHPHYNLTSLQNNIGFIILATPITEFSDIIKAINLPPIDSSIPYPFEEGRVTGFGLKGPQQFAQRLQQAFQRVTTNSECSIRYPQLEGQMVNHFCGRDRRDNTNVCGGDQGAPFVLLVRGEWTLVTQFLSCLFI